MNKHLNTLKIAFANFINRLFKSTSSYLNENNYNDLSSIDSFLKNESSSTDYISDRYKNIKVGIAQGTVKETLRGTILRNSKQTLTPSAKKKLIEDALIKATSISDTVKDQMRTVFAEAAKRDLNLQETRELLKSKFKDIISEGKIDTIADTEYRSAYNYGQNHALERLAAKGQTVERTWRTSGTNVRQSHADLEGETRLFGETFNVGGHEAEYPMDPSLPAEEAINCNCFLDIKIKDDKDE